MADQKESKERKIPVFSVWKNNVILKNIFLVNAPPPLDHVYTQRDDQEGENGETQKEFEETLVVGRHPDCDIRLEHPSISRFHLRIHSKPSSLNLSLTDLSSVHGTWVSGKKIEPNVRTMLKEGDTLRIGGSSRIYKLHWIPLNQAYDTEHRFVPPLDYPDQKEDEEEEIIKDENYPGSKNEAMDVVDSVSKPLDSLVTCDGDEFMVEEDTELVDSDFDGLESLFRDEDNNVCVQKDIQPAPWMQNPSPEALENEDGLEMDSILECLVPLFLGENWEWIGHEESCLASPQVDNNPLSLKYEDEEFVASVLEGSDPLFLENSKLPVLKFIPSAPPLLENMSCDLELKLNNTLADERRGGELLGELNQGNGKQDPLQYVQDSMWNFWDGSIIEPCSPAINGVLVNDDNKENQCSEYKSEPKVLSRRKYLGRDIALQNSPTKEHETGRLWSFWSGNMGIESVCSPLSSTEAFSESENVSLRKDYQSPLPFSSIKKQLEISLITPEQNSAQSIWSRRGKQESAPQVVTSRTEGKKTKTDLENVKHDPISRALFHGVDDQDKEEIFTPDKENLTPNTHRSLRKFAVLNEIKHSNTSKSSLFVMPGSLNIQYENGISPASDKENFSPKVLQEKNTEGQASVSQVQTVQLKQRKGEKRVPFQILLANSPRKSKSETCYLDAAMRSGNSVCCAKGKHEDKCSGGRIQKWNMIVDTTTLLNKESRKALELLEGLKGTQLIIPRIVIRELDCLKRQTSFFRRNSEVSSALEWIQDCMIKTQWWIHVQSSIEEGLPVAPTPPASPHSQYSFGTVTSVPLFEPRPELLSPTAEDHVLDYALSFRKTKDEGQLVLLSNDVTLKIKAMAEGLICERAEAFRESLVNPFSERFLWADSSPRGQTWSCSDDIVLREKFYPSSLKMTPKAIENVKGLKLILLHNSQYFERMTAIN